MSERNPTRRQYLLAAGASSIAVLSGCSSGGDDGSGQDENQDTTDGGDGSGQDETQDSTDGGDGSGQDETQDSTDGGDGTESSSGDFTPWISGYGTPTKTRSTPDGTPDNLEPKTQYEFEKPIGVPAPVVTESGVFVLGSRIIRVDPSTGETAYERGIPVGDALFVQDGVVVTGGGTSSRIVAIDAETGDRAWIAELESPLTTPFPAGEGIGYIAGTSLGVLDPDSGDHILEETVQDRIEKAKFPKVLPQPETDTVYLSRAGIDAYSLADGTRRWHVDMPTEPVDTPTPVAVVGELVYVASPVTQEIVALDTASGEEQWRIDAEFARFTHYAVDTERLYTRSGREITAYDRRDGSELWTTPFTNSMQGLAAAGDALVYVTSNSIRTLSKTTGEQQLSLRLEGFVDSSPPAFPVAIAGGNIYFTGGVSMTRVMTVF